MKLFGCGIVEWCGYLEKHSQNRVRKKGFGRTFCFSNCHIIGLDTGGLVFLVSVCNNCAPAVYNFFKKKIQIFFKFLPASQDAGNGIAFEDNSLH
jgi:hypothetical protein